MFRIKSPSWLLFCALLCSQSVLGVYLPLASLTEREVGKPHRHHEPRANPIQLAQTIPTLTPMNTARSIGIHIQVGTKPILPQAVGQLLIQAIFTAFVEFGSKPGEVSNTFHHAVSSRVPNFDVEFQLSARGNQTGDYILTNSRLVEVLSLLGFDYSNQLNASSMVEYSFDVVIDQWMKPEVIIAHGSVKNIVQSAPASEVVHPRI